jgi:hypothetical protein
MICLVVLSPLEEDGGLVGLVVLCSQQKQSQYSLIKVWDIGA